MINLNSKSLAILALIGGIIVGVAGCQLIRPKRVASDSCAISTSRSQSFNLMIMDGKVEPSHITARQCDTLTIMNMDHQTREIAFGSHDNHVAYNGVAEKVLNSGDSFMITLVQTGSFRIHDHLGDAAQAFFMVLGPPR